MNLIFWLSQKLFEETAQIDQSWKKKKKNEITKFNIKINLTFLWIIVPDMKIICFLLMHSRAKNVLLELLFFSPKIVIKN